MEDKRIRVGITQGDTNGIGYEIILKTFAEPTILELCTPIVYGNPRIATYYRKGLNLNTNFMSVTDANDAQPDRMNMVVVEGFVFAPEKMKRGLTRRMECSLYMLLLPEEQQSEIETNLEEEKAESGVKSEE